MYKIQHIGAAHGEQQETTNANANTTGKVFILILILRVLLVEFCVYGVQTPQILGPRFGKVIMLNFYKANIYYLRKRVNISTSTAVFWNGRRDGIWPFTIKLALGVLVGGPSEGSRPPPSTVIN